MAGFEPHSNDSAAPPISPQEGRVGPPTTPDRIGTEPSVAFVSQHAIRHFYLHDVYTPVERHGPLATTGGTQEEPGPPPTVTSINQSLSSDDLTTPETQHDIPARPNNAHEDAASRLLAKDADDASNKDMQGPERPFKRRTVSMFWTEALACCMALLAVFAMFGTLYPYQGKPLPQWPFSIGVNTLLAAYTVALKAATSFLLIQAIALQK